MAYTTIDDPSAFFKVQLYTGSGSSQAVTFNDTDTDMQPDFVWMKIRDGTHPHEVYDAVRGVTKRLYTTDADAETTSATGLTAFGSDGFTVGGHDHTNENTKLYVSFSWKANGSGSSNEAGSINSTATSANTTSGFSIITYTGNSTSGATIGHGLGVKPAMIFCKNRDASQDWLGYHESFGATKHIKLNQTEAVGTASTRWNDTEPTTTLVTLGNDPQTNGSAAMVAYCFANVQGFSKFGSYVGNASNDGPWIHTGFKPAFVLLKNISAAGNGWAMHDNKRDPFNEMTKLLRADTSSAVSDPNYMRDHNSNGFKIRHDTAGVNGSGNTFIYAAFAEAPFVNSKGVPCNAR